jgi:hypothetical protein
LERAAFGEADDRDSAEPLGCDAAAGDRTPAAGRDARAARRHDACAAQAAVALAIVSTKDPGHFRTTAGGYFHGIVAKAKAGALHLERTLWALRNAAAPAVFRLGARS